MKKRFEMYIWWEYIGDFMLIRSHGVFRLSFYLYSILYLVIISSLIDASCLCTQNEIYIFNQKKVGICLSCYQLQVTTHSYLSAKTVDGDTKIAPSTNLYFSYRYLNNENNSESPPHKILDLQLQPCAMVEANYEVDETLQDYTCKFVDILQDLKGINYFNNEHTILYKQSEHCYPILDLLSDIYIHNDKRFCLKKFTTSCAFFHCLDRRLGANERSKFFSKIRFHALANVLSNPNRCEDNDGIKKEISECDCSTFLDSFSKTEHIEICCSICDKNNWSVFSIYGTNQAGFNVLNPFQGWKHVKKKELDTIFDTIRLTMPTGKVVIYTNNAIAKATFLAVSDELLKEEGDTPYPRACSTESGCGNTHCLKTQRENLRTVTNLDTSQFSNTIFKSEGNRNLIISENSEGKLMLEIDRPPITKLVFSGGGAKAAAYPGGIKYLEEAGILKDIHSMYGSSAGAVVGAFLGTGHNADELRKQLENVPMSRMIDEKETLRKSRTVVQNLVVNTLDKLTNKVGRNYHSAVVGLGSSGYNLNKMINDACENSILKNFPDLENKDPVVFNRVVNGTFTFGDMCFFSQQSNTFKQLYVTTSIGLKEDDPQLLLYSSEDFAQAQVTQCVTASMAVPILVRNQKLKGDNFIMDGYRAVDGGICTNTPVPELINYKYSGEWIEEDEALIFVFDDNTIDINKPPGFIGKWLGRKIKAENMWSNRCFNYTRLKHFEKQTIRIPLKIEGRNFAGLSGTLSLDLPSEQCQKLQDALYIETKNHCENRHNDYYLCESFCRALLCFKDKLFADIINATNFISKDYQEEFNEIIQKRQNIESHLLLLKLLLKINPIDHKMVIEKLDDINNLAGNCCSEWCDYIAKCLYTDKFFCNLNLSEFGTYCFLKKMKAMCNCAIARQKADHFLKLFVFPKLAKLASKNSSLNLQELTDQCYQVDSQKEFKEIIGGLQVKLRLMNNKDTLHQECEKWKIGL